VLFLFLILILAAELAFGILLCGMLLIALVLTRLHRHPSADYELCSTRGKLIDTCIFEGVPRENPWLETLYANINSVLLYPEQNLIPLPDDEPPPAIRALQPSLRDALQRFSRHRLGSYLQRGRRAKYPNRLQREKARQFLEMIYRWASRADVNCSERRFSETRSMVLRS
jgi:hypothetical protein